MKKRIIPLFLCLLMPFSLLLGSCTGEKQSVSENENNSLAESKSESGAESSIPEISTESSGDTSDSPSTRPEGYPTLCGGFMQPNAFKNYTEAQLVSHLQTMYEVGIDTVILQWSFTTEDGFVKDAYFESSFDKSLYSPSFDKSGERLVENLLSAAEKVGVKVFIGLNDNAQWWQKSVSDRAWLAQQAELGINGAAQIYAKYKQKYPNALHGWYFVFEFYNMPATKSDTDNAAYLLNSFREPLYKLDKNMPMMLSPFISSAGASPEMTESLWKAVFAGTDFKNGDIFCCQDSVGAGHITMSQLEPYYAAIKNAVDSEKGLLFWANNEDFTQADWTTAPLDRFIDQLKITDKYVSAHITFAYSHYQHPDMKKTGYHLAYAEYYKTGRLPECTLPAPEVEYTTENDGGRVSISIVGKNKDKLLLGFRIYKNGELLHFTDFSSQYGQAEYRYTRTDANVDAKGSAKYKIVSVDFYNNESEPFEFTVEYKAVNGKNIAASKKYQSVTPPEANYSDESGTSLTDGKNGSPDYFDPAWNGYLGKAEIIIDLGESSENLFAVSLNTLGGGSADVYHPSSVAIYASNDGTNFEQIKLQPLEADLGIDTLNTKKQTAVFNEKITARYIKIIVSTNKSWIFIDEIEILSE